MIERGDDGTNPNERRASSIDGSQPTDGMDSDGSCHSLSPDESSERKTRLEHCQDIHVQLYIASCVSGVKGLVLE